MMSSSVNAKVGASRQASIWIVTLLFTLVLQAGCKPPPRPIIQSNKSKSTNRDTNRTAEKTKFDIQPPNIPLKFAIEAPLNLFDAYYFNGEQIGYSHIESELLPAKQIVRYKVTEKLYVKRGDIVQHHELIQSSEETTTGQLLSFQSDLVVNDEKTTTTGQVKGNQLLVGTTKAGTTTNRTVPWSTNYRGLLGLRQFLHESPPKVGKTHTIAVLAPLFYDLGQIELKAIGSAAVPLVTGETVSALEIETVSSIAGSNMLQTFAWIDEDGNLLKSYVPSLQLTIIGVDEETARSFETPQQDVLAALSIPVTHENIPKPDNAGRVVFSVTATDPKVLDAIQPQPGQLVKVGSESNKFVGVDFRKPDPFPALVPSPGDSSPSQLIESEDPQVAGIAGSVIATGNKLALATELSKVVYDQLVNKNLNSGFVSAASAATSRSGDCTEHALLLTAFCRNRGIPARVAVGLIYAPSGDSAEMRFHMWTVAYVDDGWIHLDAMQPNGLASADRITLLTDDLFTGSEYSSAMVVAGLAGKLSVEIKQVDPRPAPEVVPDSADPLERLLRGE